MGMFSVLPEAIAVRDAVHAKEIVEKLADRPILAVDTETTGLSRPKDRAIILAISDGRDRYAAWPEAIPYFKPLLENPETKLIMHNANFDQWMLLNVGIDLNRHAMRTHYRVYDTMVMHALIDDQIGHDLKSLTKNYLGIDMVPFKNVFGSQMRKRSLEDILLDAENVDIVANYAALDAYATYKLFLGLREELVGTELRRGPYKTMWEYYTETELPFTKVLWEMERVGITIDKPFLVSQGPEIEKKLIATQRWFCKKLQSMTVNVRSTAEMSRLFFGKLGYKPDTYTDKGAPQLSQAVLKKWVKKGCPYATKLLEFRDLDKKLSTYITNLLDKIHTDSRIHASFNQTGARTGRLSSSDPNLQNQPGYIREAFVPARGHKLFASDYAQLEMRILAHFSKDETLCNAIRDGEDVHTSTASTMFRVPYEHIMEARRKDDNDEDLTDYDKQLLRHRKAAKAINFGLMYGQGAGALSGTLGCPIEEARGLIRQYFNTFPKVTDYFKRTIANAKDDGFCSTILGRRRQVPGLRSAIRADVSQAERKVKNSPIQGSASDITKCAMIKVWEDPYIQASGAKMVAQVHDEIVFEVPEHYMEDPEFNKRVQDLMSAPFDFDLAVPLETSSKYGSNWLECK